MVIVWMIVENKAINYGFHAVLFFKDNYDPARPSVDELWLITSALPEILARYRDILSGEQSQTTSRQVPASCPKPFGGEFPGAASMPGRYRVHY